MCSLSYIQPQFSLPASHLASIWSALRSFNLVNKQAPLHRHSRHSASSVPSATADIHNLTVLPEHVNYIFCQLGVNKVSRTITSSALNRVLCPSLKSSQLSHLTAESQVSAATFFENKYGFPERLLSQMPSPLLSPLSQHLQMPALNKFVCQWQHVRGFKTKHSGHSSGFGSKRSGMDDNFKALRLSVFDKMSGSTRSSDKLRTLLSDVDTTPAVQEKLKVAFAEGYMANEKKGESTAVLMSWPRRVLRIVWYALIIWLAVQILQTYSAMGGNMKINVLKGERFEVNPEEISVTFDDVKGVDEAKQELTDIVEYLRDPDKFKALGAKLPKGVLLVGPPGIGKSLLARAIAGEAGVPFFHASGSEFDEIFVGTGAKRVRQLFDAAKLRTPCIVFIDEIDTVGAKRTSSQIHPYANQTINQLLSEMDGFQQNEGIIVLGATNRRDNLDKALLRPGRFDVEVRVFPPDLKGRHDIIEHYLSKVKFGSDVDIDKVARSTTGCTGADLENMVNQAALKAAMDGKSHVTMGDMEFARDKVLMGPAKKTRIPDDETNLLTAYHEAGHTLVAMFTKDATSLNKVTIIPRGASLGHTSFVPDKEQYNMTKSQLLAQMDVSMGGRVAEEIVFGADKVTTGAAADFQGATAIATAMVKRFGMSEKVGVRVFHEEDVDTGLSFLKLNEVGPATTEMVDAEIKRLLQESYERARVILKAHQTEHKLLAQALLKHETLDVDDVKAIIDGKPIRRNGVTATNIRSPVITPTAATTPIQSSVPV